MGRPSDPAKRAALLERCFVAATQSGSFALSLDALATCAGTSARMLVYHFGSKEALDTALVSRLEVRLRERFSALAGPARSAKDAARTRSPATARAILAVWDELTAPEMRGLLRLTVELRLRALRGDVAAQRVIKSQTAAWRTILTRRGLDTHAAEEFLMLVEGATSQLLLTGDAKPGRAVLARSLGRR